MQSAAVFGAGIAGLTAAHELLRLGYKVSVYESNLDAGGFFRSARCPKNGDMPTEYSWHGMGPWYHNTFDLLRQIPFNETSSLFDKGLSRPINFCIAPDDCKAQFFSGLLQLPRMFRLGIWEGIRWYWLLMKTWTSDQRSVNHYARLNAAEQWAKVLSERGLRAWRASFGPWIGSDWKNVSYHTAGQFCQKQLSTKPCHSHPEDEEGPAWTHGPRQGWLLLRGPSSEIWFDKWVKYLSKQGASFVFGESLERLEYDGSNIRSAKMKSGKTVIADFYVLATNPFAAAEILERTPALVDLDQLRLFRPLVQDGPHTQVSFRIAFAEPIFWPHKRTAIVLADSEYNLTIFAQEQAWFKDTELGHGIKSLWTGTACVSSESGRVHNLPLAKCTKEQFVDEVIEQMRGCHALERMVQQANGGQSWTAFSIQCVEVWHEWLFSSDGIRSPQPKWVNSTQTQSFQPTQRTPVSNLMLAGAHTQTQADVWSIEAAVESGRRAVQVIEPSVQVIPQYKPALFRTLAAVDNLLYRVRAPQVLNAGLCLAAIMTVTIIVYIFAMRAAT